MKLKQASYLPSITAGLFVLSMTLCACAPIAQALQPKPSIAAHPSSASNPLSLVGAYRIEQRDPDRHLEHQINITLNSDYSVVVTWVRLLSDTLAVADSFGSWRALDTGDVRLVLTETNRVALPAPLHIELAIENGVVVEIRADGESEPVAGTRFALGSGDRHPAVRRLHAKLADIPWLAFQDPGLNGDVYGALTYQAVIDFQISQGLPATGIVDAATWAALDHPLQPGQAGTTTTEAAPAATTVTATAALPSAIAAAAATPPGEEVLPTLAPNPIPPTATSATAEPGTPTGDSPVQPTPPPGACPAIVTASDAVWLRAGPSTDYGEVALIPAASPLSVVGRNPEGTWYQAVFYDLSGWVYAELVAAACLDDLPVLDWPTPTPAPEIGP